MPEDGHGDGRQPFFSLEQKLGYRFQNPDHAHKALTHSSKSGSINNERLEFLGDRVLNLVMAQALYERFPNENEGSLAKRHSILVQGKTLATIAADISLGDHVILSDGERLSGGASNGNILSDAMEALLGAVFLDGGLAPAQDMIIRLWDAHIQNPATDCQDPKTALQEWVQARGLPLPEYDIASKSGPDHAPRFEIELRVRGCDPVIGEGTSRRHAEKAAAAQMLSRVKDKK